MVRAPEKVLAPPGAREKERRKGMDSVESACCEHASEVRFGDFTVPELVLQRLAGARNPPDDHGSRARISTDNIPDQEVARLEFVQIFGSGKTREKIAFGHGL